MKAAITGGAGFIGTLVARELLAGEGVVGELDELFLLDIAAPQPDVAADARVRPIVGALGDTVGQLPAVDVVFHLAGVVSGAAEADFDLGMRTNLDDTRALLERARSMGVPPVVVFSSSLAVYGTDPEFGLPAVVDDQTLPRPQSSYGIQKFIGEQLVADYTRKGFLRGRTVRLMTISVRPGKPNAAASSFLSGIIREPLAGERAVCPVDLDTEVALSSPSAAVRALLVAATVDDATWGSPTAVNIPALTTTPRAMLAALDRASKAASGPASAALPSTLVDLAPDPAVEAIVTSWPARFATARAAALGLRAPADFDEIVHEYLAQR
ncbi:NAD-dependent epimerase/dehydratase family protein [Herbiconiux moechotypicola]|uniref:SDR family oxidoreductase n=1 Tax=Herbiconiux moechotypicola TaxID=637393 RepID=A0ABN3DHD8_9MICO|nr:D-erythronate dehydrogenase [Herbiconiux moechotypicola]MCS5729621.1 NAD-dependent epimerase/dehydratase family protein [Herbiconiux moechotypicola]